MSREARRNISHLEVSMRILIAIAGFLLGIPPFTSAQERDHSCHAQAYSFLAEAPSSASFAQPGRPTISVSGSANAWQFGGGGEVFVYRGLGLGGELLRSSQSWEGNSLSTIVGSTNLSYHFGSSMKRRAPEPFITGGYTFFYVPGIGFPHENGGNFGAGLNIWLGRHAALRLEIRDDIGGQDLSAEFEPVAGVYYQRSSNHLVGFRIGVTFR